MWKENSAKKEGKENTGRSKDKVARSREKAQRRIGVVQKREGSATRIGIGIGLVWGVDIDKIALIQVEYIDLPTTDDEQGEWSQEDELA